MTIINPNPPDVARDVVRAEVRRRGLLKRLGRIHEQRVRSLGCIVCRRLRRRYVFAAIHHCRFPVGAGQRSSSWYAIPLARPLHQKGYLDEFWPWPDDVAIHAGVQTFAQRYGTEQELLTATYALLPYDMPQSEEEILALEFILKGGLS